MNFRYYVAQSMNYHEMLTFITHNCSLLLRPTVKGLGMSVFISSTSTSNASIPPALAANACLLPVFALDYLFVYTSDHFLMTSQGSLVRTGGSETIQGTDSRVCFSLSVV